MKITIEFPTGPRVYDIDWLEAVRVVAGTAGYDDVDVETYPNKVTIDARGDHGSEKATGKTLADACAQFCSKVSKS